MDRAEMEARAKALGINFDDDTDDEDLQKSITDKEEADKRAKDPSYLETELKKVIDQRDRAKTERNTLKGKMVDLEDQLTDMVSGERFKELEKKLEDLTSFKTDAEKKIEADELAKKSKVEVAEIRAKKAEDALEKSISDLRDEFSLKLKEKDDTITAKEESVKRLRNDGLKAEIVSAAAESNAIGPALIYKMLKDEFSYDTDLDKYVYHEKDKKGKIVDEKEVGEYVTSFLEKEDNDYLVKGDSEKKSMHTKKTKKPSYTPKSGEYDPNNPDLIAKADLERMPVEDYIETLIMRDEKMGLVQKAKENNET
jgi:hypothetical protein